MNMTGGDMKEVDCRPSDAIAIAVRGGQMVVGKDGSESWFASVQDAQKFLEEQGIAPDAKGHEIRSKVPIFVVEGVLEKAGIMMDQETGKPVEETPLPKSERVGGEATTAVTDEEMERMSAFSDFLQNLPGLEELGGTSNS
jgi:hypothetical protein